MTRSSTMHWAMAHEKIIANAPYKSMSAALRELERRGLIKPLKSRQGRCVIIDPRESKVASYTDIVTAVALMFTVVVTPFEVSFLPPTSTIDTLFVLNRFVDVAFLIDMGMQFILMVPTSNDAVEGTKWEDNPVTIALKYFKGWFLIDLFSQAVSALDWVAVVDDNDTVSSVQELSKFKVLRIVRVLRLVKLARLLRASRILKRWETRVAINYGLLQIIRVGFLTVALAHISACIWALQTVIVGDLGGTWVEAYGYCEKEGNTVEGRTYVTSPGGHPGWVCLDPLHIYFASIYWSIMTITSIGYGDISATHGNATEQAIATVLMFATSIMWGRVIATFCEVLSTMNPSLTDFRITMDNLNRYVKRHNLPQPLRQRLRDYFHRTQHLQRTTAFRSVLLRMSPTLQLELLWHTNRVWLQRVQWLQNAECGFIVQLVLSLKPMVFAPSELVTGNMLYIVWRGVAIYGGRMVKQGGIWGDDMLIASEKLRSKWCARALTYLEVYMISRAELLTNAYHYEDTYRHIRRHIMFLTLKRGLMYIAERLKAHETAMRSMIDSNSFKAKKKPPGVDNAELIWALQQFNTEPVEIRKPNIIQVGHVVDKVHAKLMLRESDVSQSTASLPTTGELSSMIHLGPLHDGGFSGPFSSTPKEGSKAPKVLGSLSNAEHRFASKGASVESNGTSLPVDAGLSACYKAGRITESLRQSDDFLGASVELDVQEQATVQNAIAGGVRHARICASEPAITNRTQPSTPRKPTPNGVRGPAASPGGTEHRVALPRFGRRRTQTLSAELDALREEMRAIAAEQNRALADLTREIAQGFAMLKDEQKLKSTGSGWLSGLQA